MKVGQLFQNLCILSISRYLPIIPMSETLLKIAVRMLGTVVRLLLVLGKVPIYEVF